MKNVKIVQWRKGLPKGYDISDDAKNGFEEMDYAIVNAKEFKLRKIGGFTMITGIEASKMKVSEVSWIVDGLLPRNFKAILGGTTGSNKSYFALELGMSVADGKSTFLGYQIPKQLKVLFVDKVENHQFLLFEETFHIYTYAQCI